MKTTVPIDIRDQFVDALGRENEVWSLSSSRNRAGDPGETWVVASKTRLLIGDRGFGGPVNLREVPLKSITGVELEGGSFGSGRAVLTGAAGALDAICFSALERDTFSALGNRIRGSDEQGAAQVLTKSGAEEIPMALPLDTAPPPKKAPARRGPLPPRSKPVPSGGAFELFLDQPCAFPGFPLRGVLRLHWPKARHVRGVRLFWNGNETTRITTGSGKHQKTHVERHAWASQSIPLFGEAQPLGFFGSIADAISAGRRYPVLAADAYEYPFEFDVDAHAPGSYAGRHATVAYELFAQVDVPRAFDLSVRYPVRVVARPPERTEGQSGVSRGSVTLRAYTNAGPAGPGVPITGAFTVENSAGKRIRGAHLQVLRVETARASRHSKVTETPETALYWPGERLGGEVPFQIALPDSFSPWRGRFSSISYVVKVSLDIAWAFDIQVTLSV